MHILVFNCGSSSIKYRLFDMQDERIIMSGLIEKIGQPDASHTQNGKQCPIHAPDHASAMADLCDHILRNKHDIAAVGHRVVHGGETFKSAIRITPDIERTIEQLGAFAPLHNPHNLSGIRAAQKNFPKAVHVAVFDTAFHQTAPPHAYLYALPYAFYEQDHMRRYGFHGTSHRYVSQRAALLLGHPFTGITCHLGNGCSITAIQNGQSIDTSMGFTPLEGVPMGTRSGNTDPALVLNLARRFGIDETDQLLNRKSGLLGLSGLSNDLRALQHAAESGHQLAALSLDVFAYHIRKHIGAYLAVLGHADAIVFTGGIGENSIDMRSRILKNLDGLGIQLDPDRNTQHTGTEGFISTPTSPIKLLVIPTDEERLIARDTHQLILAM